MQQITIDWTAPPHAGQALKEQGQQRAAYAQTDAWWEDCLGALRQLRSTGSLFEAA